MTQVSTDTIIATTRKFFPDEDTAIIVRSADFANNVLHKPESMIETPDAFFERCLWRGQRVAEMGRPPIGVAAGISSKLEDIISRRSVENDISIQVSVKLDNYLRLWASVNLLTEEYSPNVAINYLAQKVRDKDVKAIFLADILDNLDTLHYIAAKEKRDRIASEYLSVYPRIAEVWGFNEQAKKIRELCLKYLSDDYLDKHGVSIDSPDTDKKGLPLTPGLPYGEGKFALTTLSKENPEQSAQSDFLDASTVKQIGSALRAKRRAAEMTQKDVASKTGISERQVRHIEEGERDIGIKSISKYASLFGGKLDLRFK